MKSERNVNLGGLLVVTVMLLGASASAQAPQISNEDVYWLWDTTEPVGTAQLVRSPSGLTGILRTSELPPDQAVTLWFIFFNHPENCASSPCAAPDDVFAEGVQGDFHVAGGNVVGGGGEATFAGHLNTGDTSGSGRIEIGDDGFPLIDPYEAEVILAVHSHGPKLEGQALKEQISSFLGGCEVFLGPDGLASGPEHLPVEAGECSTVQFSHHLP